MSNAVTSFFNDEAVPVFTIAFVKIFFYLSRYVWKLGNIMIFKRF